MAAVLTYTLGAAVLTLGRKLFWLFVGAVGFGAGLMLAPQFPEEPEWLILVIALVAGLLGAVLAILVQKIAVFVAGFVAGGYLLLWLLTFLNLDLGNFQGLTWAFFILGGIIGAVMIGAIFDMALIILSSAAGAGMISYMLTLNFGLQQVVTALAFLVLFAVGVAIQISLKKQED